MGETMTEPNESAAPGPSFEEAYAGSDELFKGMMDDWDEDAPSAPEPKAPVSAEDQPDATTEEVEAPDVSVAETEKPAANAAEVEKVKATAALLGAPKGWLETATDEEIADWTNDRAKGDADVKRAFRERAELQRELEGLKATKASEPAQAVPTDAEDQKLSEMLSEEFGEERGKQLAELISARDARSESRVQAVEAALEQRLAKAVWSDVRQRLGVEDTPDTYDAVVNQARALAQSAGPWDSLKGDARADAIFTAAARIVVPDAPSDAELRRRAAISAARKNGTPTAAPQRAASKKPLTHEEITDAKLDAITRGESDITKLRAIGSK